MKKIWIVVIALLLNGSLYGQIARGIKQTGGELLLNISSTNDGASETNEFTFIPNFGYFISDQLSVGGGVGFKIKGEEFDNTERFSSAVLIAPFARYHIPVSENFLFFGQGTISFQPGTVNTERRIGNETIKTKNRSFGFRMGVTPGIVFFLNDHFGLEAGLGFVGYESYGSKAEEGNEWINEYRRFKIDFGVNSFSFGMKYYF